MLDFFKDPDRNHKLAPAVLAAALSACATETVLLNSERIEQQFGSYGIDVLASEAGLRRSSLYSLSGKVRVTRTYAIVKFNELDTSYDAEHAKVLAGNSLGEVFRSNGWDIHKQNLYIGEFEATATASELQQLMQVPANQTLALHVYQLLLVKDERVFEYATIAEAHHPAYLTRADLLEIYQYDHAETLSKDALQDLVGLFLQESAHGAP